MIPIGRYDERRVRQPLDLGPGLTTLLLRLIKVGWDTVCENEVFQIGCHEREMTEFLLEGMRRQLDPRLSSENGGGVAWQENITVARGTEVAPLSGHSGVAGIPDISVYFHDIRTNMNYHDPHAVIECKRVSGSSRKLCQLYVRQGIGRFASGKYARDHSVGFMVGYLLDGSISVAVERINAYLRDELGPSELLAKAGLQWSRSVHVSRHERRGPATPIVVHHTFLRVPS